MGYAYFHPEEKFQVWALEGYDRRHPGTCYLVEFADGEAYVCRFFSAGDSENGCDLDIEPDHPLYDEFHEVTFEVLDTVSRGLRPYEEWLTVDYRDFPARITDLGTGRAVYPGRRRLRTPAPRWGRRRPRRPRDAAVPGRGVS